MKGIVVCYFGNELIEDDRLAIDVANELKKYFWDKIEFKYCFSPEEITKVRAKKVIIMDVSPNVDTVVLTNEERIKQRMITSLHDFDLNFYLKLAKKIGSIKHVDIILLPTKTKDIKAVVERVKSILEKIYLKEMS